MALRGETVESGASTKCGDEGCPGAQPGVYQSFAGWYYGYWCDLCGPYSRESGYYATKAQAEQDQGMMNAREYGFTGGKR